jgi:hypothetical protein
MKDLRSRKVRRLVLRHHESLSDKSESEETMSLFILDLVLDAVLWVSGIRGHIPQLDGFPVGQSGSSFAARTGALVGLLAAGVGFLSIAMWAAVWIALRLL